MSNNTMQPLKFCFWKLKNEKNAYDIMVWESLRIKKQWIKEMFMYAGGSEDNIPKYLKWLSLN